MIKLESEIELTKGPVAAPSRRLYLESALYNDRGEWILVTNESDQYYKSLIGYNMRTMKETIESDDFRGIRVLDGWDWTPESMLEVVTEALTIIENEG